MKIEEYLKGIPPANLAVDLLHLLIKHTEYLASNANRDCCQLACGHQLWNTLTLIAETEQEKSAISFLTIIND